MDLTGTYEGTAHNAPKDVYEEVMEILGWIIMKHGPFSLPSREQILKDLHTLHEDNLYLHKDVVRDEHGKSIGNRLYVAPKEAHGKGFN